MTGDPEAQRPVCRARDADARTARESKVARPLGRQDDELELRVAALDDRDRRLGEAEEALAERRRRLRDEELRLQAD